MVVLGSREQMCINRDVQNLRGRAQNHACRSLTKGRNCKHYNGVAGIQLSGSIDKPCLRWQAELRRGFIQHCFEYHVLGD